MRWNAITDLWMYTAPLSAEAMDEDEVGEPPAPAALGREPAGGLNEREAALARSDLFGGLSYEQRQQVAAIARVEDLRSGEILGVAGQPGDTLYVLADGQIQLMAPAITGHLTVRVAGAGETWPLACLVGDAALITSAVALTDVQVLALPCEALTDLLAAKPDIGFPVFRAVAEILAGRYRSMLGRVCRSADEAFLLAEAWANV